MRISDDTALIEQLRAATAKHLHPDVRVEGLNVALGGGSNNTYAYDAVLPDGERLPLILRQETFAGRHNIFLPPEVQYRCVQVAHAGGVLVPKPYFLLDPVDGLGAGFVMARIEGEGLPRKLLRDAPFATARERLPTQLGEVLGTLHRIDPAQVDFLGTPPPGEGAARREIAMQRRRLDDYGEPHPAMELGLRWLEDHAPTPRRLAFLHGDFRNGNFLVGPEGLRAVLDWELCHIGDPMEDLGWLCMKAWRFGRLDQPAGGFGPREPFYEAYERTSGIPVDTQAVYFWEVYAALKWGLINVLQAYYHLFEGRESPVFAACGRNVCQMEYDLLQLLDAGPP
jgi:aminoglycoside phosphotransferase (APT) family kinase protein